jgi:hypothetical protein
MSTDIRTSKDGITATREWVDEVIKQVSSWNGIRAEPHRFGGTEFDLAGREVGHIHRNGMVDIPFNTTIRNQLIAEGKAEPHHILGDSGWITFYMRTEADVKYTLWLFRLAYLFQVIRGRQRTTGLADVPGELDALNLSEPMRAAFDDLLAKL